MAGINSRLARAGLPAALGLWLAACGGAEPPTPALDRLGLVAREPDARQAVAALLSAYGGWETWVAQGEVEYRYRFAFYGGDPQPRLVRWQRHWLSLGDDPAMTMEDLDGTTPVTVRLAGDKVTLERDGAPIDDPDKAEFNRVFGRQARFDALLPWNLLATGCRLEWRGVKTPDEAGAVPAGPCDVVRLRFEIVTPGGGTDDWHDVYISRRSHLVEQIHSYRAAENAYRLSVWSDHRAFDGLRVATHREAYASDASGARGRLDAVADYSDLRFTPRDKPGQAADAGH